MDETYQVYCLTDPIFYDSPIISRCDDTDFSLAGEPVPEGWRRDEIDDWLTYRPLHANLPSQGWKIHVSACLDSAEVVLKTAFDYCVPGDIAFKFIRSRQLLLLRNAKYANRGASGKFVTIYPSDDAQFERILTELGPLLDGQPGPYILNDLRWGRGPLYVRYGGFAGRYCLGPDGRQVLAIEEPGGRLVPDRRGPSFKLPEWVSLPPFLEPHLAARRSAKADELPYRIQRALHFSNGGGVYEAVDPQTAERVVLKEGRPYAGVVADGSDAIARLAREEEILGRLAGLDAVPRLRGRFTVGDHRFLAMDYVEATPLRTAIVERYPLLKEPDDTALAEYTRWALDVHARVEATLAEVHDRGVVIGDLHPFNILLRPDGRVALVDFEVASHVSEGRRPNLANAGFAPAAGLSGFDVDRYALACLRLFLFFPITQLIGLDRAKAAHLADEIAELFPVPGEFLDQAVRVICGTPVPSGKPGGDLRETLRIVPDAAGWRRASASMAEAILESATPQRDDRLFPGDVKQFLVGGLNLAYGAAGVLYALAQAGAGRWPEHEEWLIHRALRPEAGMRMGFYDGLHGVAYALDALGRREEALKVLEICVDELRGKLDHLGLDLFGGLAGIGLNLAHFGRVTGDSFLRDLSIQVAQMVADRLGDAASVATVSGGGHPYAGLTRGSSGPALFFLRLFEQSGDGAFLDLAAIGLDQDLRRCVTQSDGSLQVNEGWRSMPYLADGSVGVGFVLDDYLSHREDQRFSDAAAGIRRAAESPFNVEPGLFYGKAGMILYLGRSLPPGTGGSDTVVARQVRSLAWHALPYRGHIAFPGEELLRLSMDLASGTAGVLLALGAALSTSPVSLPFLGISTPGPGNEFEPQRIDAVIGQARSSVPVPEMSERR